MYADDFDEKEKAKLDESESNYSSFYLFSTYVQLNMHHVIFAF